MDAQHDPTRTALAPSPPSAATAPAAADAATAFGRYRALRLLGKGGYGEVYLGHDVELDRAVAVKVPRRELLARKEDVDSYLAEARILAKLDHPNIVPVFDVGRTDDGSCFIVSKFIEGSDLAHRMRQERLPVSTTVELVATVAEALHYAHRQGLVHRDIKPGNILLDKSGKPFVGDFGLALREQDVGKGPRFPGTPAYMSPEQARGEGHRVDGRSDVFSLGVVFYELLTGRRPFNGESTAEVLAQVTTLEPRPARQWDDAIPTELERICFKALSKRASDRYSTAKDMADDLRHWSRTDGAATRPNEATVEPESMLPNVGKDVFISYASPDKEAAFRLCRLLEEKNVKCWIAPRDVTPGADYAEAIVRAIEGTSATVLLLSVHANASIHVTHEVERATSRRKRVIPVCLQNVPPGPSLELHLATAHRLDAWSMAPEQTAVQLVIALRGESNTPSPADTPLSDKRPLKIVPKGLRSFDAHDADFFLELLPGPRDRDGLPDSLRFWKTRIEETDPDQAFTVGLIYGPSGCGKSSLVKAGLLPRLAKAVIAVYVEATAEETETRLLNGLRKNCPSLPKELGLKESLAALRCGQGLPQGKKVLIVLDQFEQWLHAKKDEENTELVQALRQCDGSRTQCIVMVRDDFWMAVTRFLLQLEVELLQGRNCAAADLFDPDHARKVLTAFGRAFGKLPEKDVSQEQIDFLNRAVTGLAQENKVICVRLALFAEMMKGRPWSLATLKEVGGTEGVGVTFLEDTFSSPSANPKHRLHQKAARAVLKMLLPESGTEIKGTMRSHDELLQASGYASRPKDFDDLTRILDSEIRLITPTDPEGKEDQGEPGGVGPRSSGEKYYQLTHDYLVPSLREWLTRKQKETRRGRAELLLADRASVWNARPENRQLPSLFQWVRIRSLTQKKNWTKPQRKMMRRASRYHAVRGLVVAVVLTLIGLGSWEGFGRLEGRRLQGLLLNAPTADVPGIVKEMAPYRRWVDPLLKEAYAQAEKDDDRSRQLHVSLALLPVDSGQVGYLYGRLLTAEAQELMVIREALSDHKAELIEKMWTLLENPKNVQEERFRAACALSAFDSEDARWEKVAGDMAATLVIQKPFVLAPWRDAFKGAGKWLIPPLADFLVDEKRSLSERGLIASVYGSYAADTPGAYARLEKQLTEKSEPNPSDDAKIREANIALAKRQASIGVALLLMGQSEKAWPLLKHQADPTMRTFLMERLGPAGVDPKILTAWLHEEKEISVKRAILLSLGEFGVDRLSLAEQRNQLPRLLAIYRDHPDPGMHGAAEWLLWKWEVTDKLKGINKALATGKVTGNRQWYVNRQVQTMMIVATPEEFWMGKHRTKIGRSFAIASTEVTVEQFRTMVKRDPSNKRDSPTPDCPATSISWFDAVEYCNKLSEQEDIPKEEWCYIPNKDGRYAIGMKMASKYVELSGYRLPTEEEWEYACRAGADTTFSFGEAEETLGKYGWYFVNSSDKSHPVGSKKPNDLGLFDMHGNSWEWCQDLYDANANDVGTIDDIGRVLRGGSFGGLASNLRSADRFNDVPSDRFYGFGFRVARTLPPGSLTPLPLPSPKGSHQK